MATSPLAVDAALALRLDDHLPPGDARRGRTAPPRGHGRRGRRAGGAGGGSRHGRRDASSAVAVVTALLVALIAYEAVRFGPQRAALRREVLGR